MAKFDDFTQGGRPAGNDFFVGYANPGGAGSDRRVPHGLLTGRFKYTFDASDPANSLAHQTGLAVGDTFQTEFWNASRRDCSGAVWRVWQISGTTTPGQIDNGGVNNGIQMQGTGGVRFLLVPAPGGVVDLEQVGIVCDGSTINQQSRFATVAAAAQARGLTLVNAPNRRMRITETTDCRFFNCRLWFQAGSGQGAADFYTAVGTNLRALITAANPGVITTVAADGVTPVAHGLAAGDRIRLNYHGLGCLPPNLSSLTDYFVLASGLTSTSFQVSTSANGAAINTTANASLDPGTGPFYVFIPPAAVPNMVTYDIPMWDGTIARKGVAVRAAGDGSVNTGVLQQIEVWGDGSFDFATNSTCVGVLFEGDDSPHGEHDFHTSYCFAGTAAIGSLEKKRMISHATYCNMAAVSLIGNSADTVNWEIWGTKCKAWVWEHEGLGTSIHYTLWCEGRDDTGDDSPAVWIRNGKFSAIDGQLRAHEGLRNILVDKPKLFGADTFQFNGLHIIHGYGNQIEIRRCRRVSGFVNLKDLANGPVAGGADTTPAVVIGRVAIAGGLSGQISECYATTGLQIGDGPYYSRDADFGTWSIQMDDNLNVQDSNIDATSSPWPTARTALSVQRAKGGSIRLNQCIGDVVIGQDVSASSNTGALFSLTLPQQQRRYGLTIDPAAASAVRVGFPALIDLATGRLPLAVIPDLSGDATFQEAVRDIVGATLVAGTNVTISVDDAGNAITINAAGSGGSFDGTLPAYTTTSPAAPGSGAVIFARNRAGVQRLAYRGVTNRPKSVQTLLGTNKTRFYMPSGNSTTVTVVGFNSSTVGTATTRNTANTDNFTMLSRIGFVAASAAINTGFGWRSSALQFARSNGASSKLNCGFELIVRYGWAVADGNLGRLFVGMSGSSSAVSASVDPINATNCVFIGADDGDANLSIYCNDGTGTCTKTSLGASFPAKTAAADAYEVRIGCAPDGAGIFWSCENLFTGAYTDGQLTTDIPAPTTLLAPQVMGSTGSSVNALGLDIVSVYMESDY